MKCEMMIVRLCAEFMAKIRVAHRVDDDILTLHATRRLDRDLGEIALRAALGCADRRLRRPLANAFGALG